MIVLLALTLQAPPAPHPARDLLSRLAREISDRAPEDVETSRPELRRRLRSALGLDPLPPRTPVEAVVTSAFEEEAFRVETLLFQPVPGFSCTANLYLPKGPAQRRPGILYVCGHAQDPLGAKVKYQHHPVWLASHGYVVLIVDPIQISEIEGIHHGTHRYGLWHWQALGYTPLGFEVWCAMRSLDVLAARPEVDPERLGMTGRSGGGTMTWFTMALDDRVKAGVTANATGRIATHVAHDTLRGHCDCAFFINHVGIDYTDVAALCAPRPVLVQSGQKDWIYPPEGYRPLGEASRAVWTRLGAPEKFREQDVDAEHKDLMEFRTEAFRWFEKWLKGVASAAVVTEVAAIDPRKLRAVRGPLPPVRNAFIAEEFPGPHRSAPPADPAARAVELRARLAELTFAREPAAPGPLELRELGNGRWSLSSEPGQTIEVERLGPERGTWVLVAVGDVDVEAAAAQLPVVRVWPRGRDWPADVDKFVRRAAPLVGRSLGTMRTTDVLRAVAAARAWAGAGRVALYGKGEGAMLALAAAVRQPVDRLALEDLPDSLLAEPILLNAARFTDVPELLELAAPCGLVFLGRSPLGFDRARRASDRTTRAASLRELVEVLTN
jgi:hypothetical protein